MKKIILFLFALVLMSNSECENEPVYETYLVVEKGNNVSSHFNPFHKDHFAVETDYYITLQNVTTKNTFVHKCFDGNEYYQYQVGKKYKIESFLKIEEDKLIKKTEK